MKRGGTAWVIILGLDSPQYNDHIDSNNYLLETKGLPNVLERGSQAGSIGVYSGYKNGEGRDVALPVEMSEIKTLETELTSTTEGKIENPSSRDKSEGIRISILFKNVQLVLNDILLLYSTFYV